TITVVKDMGLVINAFDNRTLAPLQGHLAIGHVRYSTTGSSSWENAQPIYRSVGEAGFALGHNGNLVNTSALAGQTGTLSGTVTSDSDVVAELMSDAILADGEGRLSDGRDLERALMKVLPRVRGAFSFVIMDDGHLIGARDPNGFRPLCLGRLPGGWVLASETPALDIVGAHFVRELEPGEMVVVDASGVRSLHPFPADAIDPKLCLFEFVYFARPDSQLYGQTVHTARQRVVVVDDSIVRGTTQRALVRMLREAGATEVHLRISLPPVAWPCYFGMDFGTRTELVAANMSVGEIREYLGCDSLAYLELDRLVAATGTSRSGFCTACLTGEYPIDVPIAAGRRSEADADASPAEQHDAPIRG